MMVIIFVLLLVSNGHSLYGETNEDYKLRLDSMTPVKVEVIPYAAVVFCNINKYFCSGTILHPEWVLTAAHCLYSVDGEYTEHDTSVTVVAGTDTANFSAEDIHSGKVQVRQSKQIEVHNKYSWAMNFINDLALIKVEEPFNMTSKVNVAPPMVLSDQKLISISHHEDYDLSKLDLTSFVCKGYGYGKVSRSTDSSKDFTLKEQQYSVSKHCHCLERIRCKESTENVLESSNIFICDEALSHSGLCSGDSGGQLVCNSRCRGMATALFHYKDDSCSRGEQHECGDKRSLDVFTDLCHYTPWISMKVPGYSPTDGNCNPINVTKELLEDI